MRPISDRIKSFKEMYIIDKRFELRIKKNNTKKFPGMKILEFKNNKKCKTKIHKHPKMRPFEKNKLEYLNIIHLDYYMKEIDTSFQQPSLKIVYNYNQNSQMLLVLY